MKRIKYLLFSLLCMFCSCLVLAKGEITIEKMIPVYDENSGVIVSEENGVHSVVFNDKDQNVKYNIVLKNNTKKDISLSDIVLPESPEEFFKYEFVGIDENTVLKSNSTEEVILSLETVKTEGWGRNFTLDLTSKVEIMDNVVNPNTSTMGIVIILVVITFFTVILITTVKSKRISRYVALIIMFGSIISVTKAKDSILLPLKLNVSFESQNVMKENSCTIASNGDVSNCGDYWKHSQVIENFYIQNEMVKIDEYVEKFDMSLEQNEKVVAYLVLKDDGPYTCIRYEGRQRIEYECDHYDVFLQADGIIYANSNASYYFYDMQILNSLNNLAGLDVSNVVDMRYMFRNTGMSSETFTLDVSSFDTSNVTNMKNLFGNTGSKSKDFTLDVSKFYTSNVTDMSYMFYNTGKASSKFTIDLKSFDTSQVTNMSSMFYGAGYSNPNFQLDLSSFNTSKVTDMNFMFYTMGYNMPDFKLDLSSFDTSKVTNMKSMFGCTGVHSLTYNLDLSNFDTSNVTTMYNMFYYAGHDSLDFNLDISSFDTSKVTDMGDMFSHAAYSHNSELILDLSHFDTSNVTEMNIMFDRFGYNATKLRIDVSSFDTSNVTDMSFMFSETGYNSTDFELDIRHFDTSKVKIFAAMFSNTAKMNPNFKLYLKENFDISNATNLNGAFRGLGYSSGNIDISVLVSKPTATTYSEMFTDAAIASGSKITVNYTSESSALVNNLIKTKSSNSNVVKGVQIN